MYKDQYGEFVSVYRGLTGYFKNTIKENTD